MKLKMKEKYQKKKIIKEKSNTKSNRKRSFAFFGARVLHLHSHTLTQPPIQESHTIGCALRRCCTLIPVGRFDVGHSGGPACPSTTIFSQFTHERCLELSGPVFVCALKRPHFRFQYASISNDERLHMYLVWACMFDMGFLQACRLEQFSNEAFYNVLPLMMTLAIHMKSAKKKIPSNAFAIHTNEMLFAKPRFLDRKQSLYGHFKYFFNDNFQYNVFDLRFICWEISVIYSFLCVNDMPKRILTKADLISQQINETKANGVRRI